MLNRLLSLIGWIGTGLVFAAVAIRFLKPEWQQYAYWGAWAGLACVLVYTLGQWREIAAAFRGRQARYGALALTSVVIVLGILVAINYLSTRRNKRWDLTEGGQFTLSEQTKKVLQNLDAPVKALVFAREQEFDRFRDRLGEYEYISKRFTTEYIDPDRRPGVAQKYQVQSYNTVVFEYKTRTERVTSDSEQDLTNGLIKAVTGSQKKVYFVQGHGEHDTTSAERSGYNRIATALGSDNYGVEKLVLAQQADVPADAAVVVLAGPRTDLFPPEIEALKRYLAKGGKLLLLIDPPEKPDSAPLTSLLALAKDWAIDVGANVVVDVSGMGQLIGTDASVPVAASYPAHAITQGFSFLTAFPFARSAGAVSGGANGRFAQNFIETSAQSWAETDIQQLVATGKVKMDAGKDTQGPVSIGAAVSAPVEKPAEPADKDKIDADQPKPETRVAVIGDSDFAANNAIGIQGNRDLFLNTINWLAQQENLIAIRPKEPSDRRITMTQDQRWRVLLFSLLIVPGAILGTGVFTWWKRR